VGALDEIADWPVDEAAAGVTSATGVIETAGNTTWRVRIASISKTLTGYASLIALEEGSISLDQPAGPPGSTVRHLLAHTSGLPFNGAAPILAPGKRRIYSNTGIERLGEVLAAAAGMSIGDYLREGVFTPLGMADTELRGSPAWGIHSNVDDLLLFARELLGPMLVTRATLDEAISVQFPGLPGVIPGLGRFADNPWGLSFEIKGAKSPHWTAPEGSARTFGHFGGSGTFLWVDPDAGIACVALTNREFGDWAPPLWSTLSSHVLSAYAESTQAET
jgi:CubicO group peptidase (beta-lactamase class C family)